MYNAELPTRAELPTSHELRRATAWSAAVAVLLLVTAVLPSEYGIDPTRIGRLLGLTQMGEIKTALAAEAAVRKETPAQPPPQGVDLRAIEQRLERIERTLVRLAGEPPTGTAVPPPAAAPAAPAPPAAAPRGPLVAALPGAPAGAPPAVQAPSPGRVLSHETVVTLRPGEGAEVKLRMRKDAKVTYVWQTGGGVVNFDVHGEPSASPRQTHSYVKGRGVPRDEGVLEAAFDGMHGWFWRNRGNDSVTLRLTTTGDYAEIKRVK